MEQYLVWTLALMRPGCSLDMQKGWYVLYTVLKLSVTHNYYYYYHHIHTSTGAHIYMPEE